MGHEFLGVIEETGAEVSEVKAGDVVVAPFVWADNTCDFCRAGLQPSCRHGGQWGCDDAIPLVRGGVLPCRPVCRPLHGSLIRGNPSGEWRNAPRLFGLPRTSARPQFHALRGAHRCPRRRR